MSRILIGANDIVGPWVCKQMDPPATWTPQRGQTLGLIDSSGIIIAGVLYDDCNGASVSMHVAAVGKRWLNRRFLWTCFNYPFNQLGVKKVVGVVPASNLAARKFDTHLGFKVEATLKDCHPDGDLIIYTMTREQCRWLELPERFHLTSQRRAA